MKIPNNYNKDTALGGERIQPGGHKCVIKQVEETRSSTGKAMLVVSFDTAAEDIQPGYFANRWFSDTRDDKKWQGNMYIVLEGEYADANLNRFLGAVDHSNEGFELNPGADLDPKVFKNLKVGVVFREEDYTAWDGQARTSVKPFRWCAYDKAPEQKIPDRKAQKTDLASLEATTPAGVPANASYGFVDVPADADETEGLPFA